MISKHREIALGVPLNSMNPLHHHTRRAIRGQMTSSGDLQAVLEQSSVVSELITVDRSHIQIVLSRFSLDHAAFRIITKPHNFPGELKKVLSQEMVGGQSDDKISQIEDRLFIVERRVDLR
jgi:hypothetical protein